MNDPTNGRQIQKPEIERLKHELEDCQASSKRMTDEIGHLKKEVELMEARHQIQERQIDMYKGIVQRLEAEASRQKPILAKVSEFIAHYESIEASVRATDRTA
jgi:chromosome segregation ATPase